MSNEFVTLRREVLEQVVGAAFSTYCSQHLGKLVPALRAALEQPWQEPVYYRSPTGSGHYAYSRFSAALDNPEPLYAAPQPAHQPDADKLLRQALEALDAELSPDWDCNSYHPKLHAAHAAIRKHLGDA